MERKYYHIPTLPAGTTVATVDWNVVPAAQIDTYRWLDGGYEPHAEARLAFLPGYGFAKVPQAEKDRWAKLMEDYFAANRITLGVLIVDYRHPPTNNDITMARWFLDSGCPFVVLANKKDKLKKSELEPNLATIRADLELPESCPVIPFSAEKGDGRDELVKCILNAVKA